MKLQFPVTALALTLWWTLKTDCILPLILANSIVGCMYMIIERDALRDIGTRVVFGTFCISYTMNTCLNFLFHLAAPTYILWSRKSNPLKRNDAVLAFLLELSFLRWIDVRAVYPTSVCSILEYQTLHQVTVLVCIFALSKSFACPK